MNGKIQSENLASIPSDLLNPFVHHLELSTTYEKIKVRVMENFTIYSLICIYCTDYIIHYVRKYF